MEKEKKQNRMSEFNVTLIIVSKFDVCYPNF